MDAAAAARADAAHLDFLDNVAAGSAGCESPVYLRPGDAVRLAPHAADAAVSGMLAADPPHVPGYLLGVLVGHARAGTAFGVPPADPPADPAGSQKKSPAAPVTPAEGVN